jgi:hypothetical protein
MNPPGVFFVIGHLLLNGHHFKFQVSSIPSRRSQLPSEVD